MDCHCFSYFQNQIFSLLRSKSQDYDKIYHIQNKLQKKFKKISLKKIQSQKQQRVNLFTINQNLIKNKPIKSSQIHSSNYMVSPCKQLKKNISSSKSINYGLFSNQNIRKAEVKSANEEAKSCSSITTKKIRFNYLNSKSCFNQLKIQISNNLKASSENKIIKQMFFSRIDSFHEKLDDMKSMHSKMGSIIENQNITFPKYNQSLINQSYEYESSLESIVIDRSKKFTILSRLIQ